MKKILFFLSLSALFLLVGCAGSPEAPTTAQKATAPVVQAQNIDYSQAAEAVEPTEDSRSEEAFEGMALGDSVAESEPGYIPDPEPVETTVESAEK